jgi:hypothetical protein
MTREDTENPVESNLLGATESGFLLDVARYFRNFLDTDFRRQRLPKRQINRQDRIGNLTGIALKKYPRLIQTIWGKLDHSVGSGLSFKIPRGRYQAKIDPQLSNLIEKFVEAIPHQATQALIDKAKLLSRTLTKTHQDDPERLTAEVMVGLEHELIRSLIVPFLKHLEAHFDENNVQSLETIFDIEDELGQRLIANAEEAIGASLNTAIVSKEFGEYDGLIQDLFDLKALRTKILDYFEGFTANDFYTELHALRTTQRIHENMDIYLYVGDLRYGTLRFPLFYLPLYIDLTESVFTITIDPHLYINKKAIDYVSQEIARSQNQTSPSLVADRIIYLDPDQSFTKLMQRMTDNWASELGLRPPIDYANRQEHKARSSQATMTNRLHFAAFDKSDESLLNDYEALLTMAEGGDSVIADFKQLVDGFLFGDPESVIEKIDAQWQATEIQDRLVYRSPIPLNEEQRKIQDIYRQEHEGCCLRKDEIKLGRASFV